MAKFPLFRSNQSGAVGKQILKACNMDTRNGMHPVARQMRTNLFAGADPARTIVPWVQGTPARPAPYFAHYTTVSYLRSGALATAATGGAAITDLCRFEDGAGAAAIIVCYGNGDHIDRMAVNGTLTASSDIHLVYATMAGADLYGVTKKGVYSTYYVSKCPSGAAPETAANWEAGIPVGSPLYDINGICAIGSAVIVGKPEGLFVYRDTTGVYEDVMTFEKEIHPDNGKGMFAGKGNVFYPTADGSLWMFDGVSAPTDISPKHSAYWTRNNMHLRAPISAGCVAGDWVYVATTPGEGGWTQEHGLTVIKYVSGTTTYTDITANLVDGDLSTTAAIGGLTTGDLLYIGADVPFEAIHFTIGTANTTANILGASPVPFYSSVTSDWESPTSVGTAGDNTYYGGYELSKDGYWRLTGIQDYGTHNVMGKVLVSGTGYAGSTKYWARVVFTSNAVSAGATLAEIKILPSRPPIKSGTFTDSGGNIAATNGDLEYTGPDNAGIFPHILAGRIEGSEWVWYDLYTLQATGPVRAMALCEWDTKQGEENSGPRLVAITQHHVHTILLGRSRMPGSPVNENYTDGVAMGTPVAYFMPTDLSDDGALMSTQKETAAYDILGEYVNSADTLTVLQRFDHNPWDVAGASNTAPVRIDGAASGEGLVLETAVAYEDVSVEIAGPRITAIDVEYETHEGANFDAHPQGNAVTPEVE
jgi:hypothetical protein